MDICDVGFRETCGDINHFFVLYEIINEPDGSIEITLLGCKEVRVMPCHTGRRMVNDSRKAIPPCLSLWHGVFLLKHVKGCSHIHTDRCLSEIHLCIIGMEREQHLHMIILDRDTVNGEIEAGQPRVLPAVPAALTSHLLV